MERKTILLIGASGGIGNKTAEILLNEGYSVIGTYLKDKEKLNKNLLKHKNFSIKGIDIRNPLLIKNLKQELDKELYAVINCAGIIEYETGDSENDCNVWDNVLATNLSGNYYLAKTFYSQISNNGRFIMISSTDAFFGGAITASYAASKAGVNSLAKSLALSFQNKKIRVNAVAAGWVLTPMTECLGQEFLQKVADMNPLKRNTNPEDVAKLIKFLLSDDADYINGQTISIEGGYTNQDPTLLLEQEVV